MFLLQIPWYMDHCATVLVTSVEGHLKVACICNLTGIKAAQTWLSARKHIVLVTSTLKYNVHVIQVIKLLILSCLCIIVFAYKMQFLDSYQLCT